MSTTAELLQLIKRAATEAVAAGKPADVIFGTVSSTHPLAITIDQQLVIPAELLVLTRNVTDYDLKISVDHVTGTGYGPNGHSHPYTGQKVFRVLNALKAGEKVIMLRHAGGQKFTVIDRIGGGA